MHFFEQQKNGYTILCVFVYLESTHLHSAVYAMTVMFVCVSVTSWYFVKMDKNKEGTSIWNLV